MTPPRNQSFQNEIDSFVSLVSMDLDDAARSVDSPDEHWNYRLIEDRPVLRLPEGLLVLDYGLMLDRFTSGLYWLVADHVSEDNREAWSRTYGLMAEDLVKRQLRAFAPRNLGPGVIHTVFDEDDVQNAYGSRRRRPKSADLVIDLGDTWLVAEIVTRNLQVGTRVRGEFACLEADIEAGVLKKARQVADTIALITQDEKPLTSVTVQGKKVLPVIVVAGSFPLEPIGSGYIRTRLQAFRELSDSRVWPLCLLDIEDLNYLEALVQAGHPLVGLLTDWKSGDLLGVPFSTYAKQKLPIPEFSSRVKESHRKMDVAMTLLFG
jgi:hypothetical protein